MIRMVIEYLIFLAVWLAFWGWIISHALETQPPFWLMLPAVFLGLIIIAAGICVPIIYIMTTAGLW